MIMVWTGCRMDGWRDRDGEEREGKGLGGGVEKAGQKQHQQINNMESEQGVGGCTVPLAATIIRTLCVCVRVRVYMFVFLQSSSCSPA